MKGRHPKPSLEPGSWAVLSILLLRQMRLWLHHNQHYCMFHHKFLEWRRAGWAIPGCRLLLMNPQSDLDSNVNHTEFKERISVNYMKSLCWRFTTEDHHCNAGVLKLSSLKSQKSSFHNNGNGKLKFWECLRSNLVPRCIKNVGSETQNEAFTFQLSDQWSHPSSSPMDSCKKDNSWTCLNMRKFNENIWNSFWSTIYLQLNEKLYISVNSDQSLTLSNIHSHSTSMWLYS